MWKYEKNKVNVIIALKPSCFQEQLQNKTIITVEIALKNNLITFG